MDAGHKGAEHQKVRSLVHQFHKSVEDDLMRLCAHVPESRSPDHQNGNPDTGGFVLDKSKLLQIVAPDLTGFKV